MFKLRTVSESWNSWHHNNSRIGFLKIYLKNSPSSVSSNEEICHLMEQGQIMEAAIASTQLVKDDTPTMEPLEHEFKNEKTEVVHLDNEIGKITSISIITHKSQ